MLSIAGSRQAVLLAAAPAEAGQEHVVDPLNKEVVRSGWNSLATSFLCLLVLGFCLFSKIVVLYVVEMGSNSWVDWWRI
jgi:hypothetical protein